MDWYCSWWVDNWITVVNELDVVLVPWESTIFVKAVFEVLLKDLL